MSPNHDEKIIMCAYRLTGMMVLRSKQEEAGGDVSAIDARISATIAYVGPLLDAEARRQGRRPLDVQLCALTLIESMTLIAAEAGANVIPDRCKQQAEALFQSLINNKAFNQC